LHRRSSFKRRAGSQYRDRHVLPGLKYHWRRKIASVAVDVRPANKDELGLEANASRSHQQMEYTHGFCEGYRHQVNGGKLEFGVRQWDRTFSPSRFGGQGEIEDFLRGYRFFYPQSFPADVDDLLGGIRTKRAVG
jgi:hypothetical protein